MSVEDVQRALAAAVHENNELRAIIRRVREYAQSLHQLADEYQRAYSKQHQAGGSYIGHLHDETAVALERIIGDQP